LHSVSGVRQIETHTFEPLIPNSSPFEFEIAIAKFKKYGWPGREGIRAELIQAVGEM
jgi:hypothetical protein